MKDLTLREMCTAFGISRRAVQGYEKAGLVFASGKNKRGHLLYDKPAQERVKQIKLFQQMGFTIREIRELIDAPNDILKPALEKQLQNRIEEKENLDALICKMYELLKQI